MSNPYKLQGFRDGDYVMVTGTLPALVTQAVQLSRRLGFEVIITRQWSGQPLGAKANKLPLPGEITLTGNTTPTVK